MGTGRREAPIAAVGLVVGLRVIKGSQGPQEDSFSPPAAAALKLEGIGHRGPYRGWPPLNIVPSRTGHGRYRRQGPCYAVRRHRGTALLPLSTTLKIPRPHIFFTPRRQGGAGIEQTSDRRQRRRMLCRDRPYRQIKQKGSPIQADLAVGTKKATDFNRPDWNQGVRQTPSLITSTETLLFSTLTDIKFYQKSYPPLIEGLAQKYIYMFDVFFQHLLLVLILLCPNLSLLSRSGDLIFKQTLCLL